MFLSIIIKGFYILFISKILTKCGDWPDYPHPKIILKFISLFPGLRADIMDCQPGDLVYGFNAIHCNYGRHEPFL
jgi:hypothetical protein